MEGFTVVRIPRGASRRFLSFLALFLSALLLTACSSYGERVAPVPLPESRADAVDVDGAKLIAQAYVDPDQAKAALGFDARGAGLLPVRFVVDNKSGKTVSVDPSQTFLVDNQGNAWPLLTSDQAYQRVKSNVSVGSTLSGGAKSSVLLGAAGAVAGFAVGVLTGQNIAETAGKGAVAGASVGAIAGGAKANQELGDPYAAIWPANPCRTSASGTANWLTATCSSRERTRPNRRKCCGWPCRWAAGCTW